MAVQREKRKRQIKIKVGTEVKVSNIFKNATWIQERMPLALANCGINNQQ